MWRKIFTIFLVLAAMAGSARAGLFSSGPLAGEERAAKSTPSWQPGEQLVYAVKWNDLSAAKITMQTELSKQGEQHGYRVEIKVNTIGMVKDIIKVDDRFTAFVQSSTGLPFRAERDILEGSKTEQSFTVFDQEKHTASVAEEKPITIPPQTHDIASLLWAIRFIDLKAGGSEKLQLFNSREKKMLITQIEPGKEDEVTTAAGKFSARELIIKLQDQNMKELSDKYLVRIWVTSDARRLPVLITAQPPFGKVRMELAISTTTSEEETDK